MTNGTARLSLKEAFDAAETELSLSGESTDTDMSVDSGDESTLGEQLVVETPVRTGLFAGLAGEQEAENEQPVEDSFEVTVDGERFLVSLDELRSGYMRQADYTLKTQRLAELQRDAEKAVALKRMLEEKPQETLRRLYQRINAGQDLDFTGDLRPSNIQDKKSPEDIDALVEARVQEALANDPRLVALQQEHSKQRLDAIFANIENEYGVTLEDSDKHTVLVEAQRVGTVDLEMVFGSLYAKKMAMDRQREIERTNARNASGLKGHGQDVAFNPQQSSPKRYDSFRAALEEQLALEQESV